MMSIRNHIFSVIEFWVFSIVLQLVFMHSSVYWPQDVIAWLITVSWPLLFLALWVGAPVLARRAASEGDTVRIGFIVKVSLLAIPLVIFGAVLLTKLESWLKPHFMP